MTDPYPGGHGGGIVRYRWTIRTTRAVTLVVTVVVVVTTTLTTTTGIVHDDRYGYTIDTTSIGTPLYKMFPRTHGLGMVRMMLVQELPRRQGPKHHDVTEINGLLCP